MQSGVPSEHPRPVTHLTGNPNCASHRNRSVRRIFVSGGTGYIGRAVIPRLTGRENIATGLVRQGSERKLPPGAAAVVGNALDAETFSCDGYDTFIHLVGTAHPAPWKGAQFRSVDLVALRASVKAAVRAGIGHFVF